MEELPHIPYPMKWMLQPTLPIFFSFIHAGI
jgi:hypothetical protein